LKIRLAVVCKDTESTAKYLEKLLPFDVEISAASGWSDLQEKLIQYEHHGLIVDVRTKLRLTTEEHEYANEVQDIYPTLYIKRNVKTEKITTMIMGATTGDSSLNCFINEICAKFPGRKMRAFIRKSINFNVSCLNENKDENCSLFQSTTIDVSVNGCFVYYSQKYELGSKISLVFKELKNQNSVVGVIRRIVPWGNAMMRPGLGIEFLEIDKEQLGELKAL